MFGRWEREGEIGGGVGRYGRGPMCAFFVFGRWERAGETGEGVSGYRSGAGYPPNTKTRMCLHFSCSATGHGIVGGGERVLEEKSKK